MSMELNETLKKHSIDTSISASAKKLLCKKYFDSTYGARSVRRGMKEIEDTIAEALLDEKISEGDKVSIVVNNGKFSVKKALVRAPKEH